MKKALVLCLVVLFAVSALAAVASAKKDERQQLRRPMIMPEGASLPSDLAGQIGALRSAAATDTFVLLDEDFDGNSGNIPPGWTTADITAQIDTFFHVADNTEMDGGLYGFLNPLSGAKSMWCGQAASTVVPYCGYAALPGYGDNWNQRLRSLSVPGDSLSISYKVFWDSEHAWDGSQVEYTFDAGVSWYQFPITDTISGRNNWYDGFLTVQYIEESFTNDVPGTPSGNIEVRFRFVSDGNTSGADGGWPGDGGITVDDITLTTYNAGSQVFTNTETFETATVGSHSEGIWYGTVSEEFGDFAALYAGATVLQEDPCEFVALFMWGFFDDPNITNYACHTPEPELTQGAMPYGNEFDIYMENDVWSPPVPNIGSGVEYRLQVTSYRDLPLDNLQFYVWKVRDWNQESYGLCPGPWRTNFRVYYGDNRDFITSTWQVGAYLDPNADAIQVGVGALDACGFWCNVVGSGACHSHAPLLDDVRLERVDVAGPQYIVFHIDMFQDNFSEDGTITGTARADVGDDIRPGTDPVWVAGDSLNVTLAPLGEVLGSPAAWIYVRVQNGKDPKSGPGLGSQDIRPVELGGPVPRWPHRGDWTDLDGNVWEIFQMDTSFTTGGAVSPQRFCVDLNDALFVPGDTIYYFIGADADATLGNGNENYYHRTLNGQGADEMLADRDVCAASPLEFSILPGAALPGELGRGGDILYVDHVDDRGGPAQLFFDTSFDLLGILHLVDRYDVLGPSSTVNNSLSGRVISNADQILAVYRKIIWNSGNLSSGLLGDGSGTPSKNDDFGLLVQFMDESIKGPGLYLSGDNIAEEWAILLGANAITMNSVWIPHNLLDGDHIFFGEPVSPTFTATSAAFSPGGVPQQFVGYGGCALINDFDVLEPTGGSIEDFPYPNAGTGNGAAVISNSQLNSQSVTATVVLSGVSYNYIRDAAVQFPPARTEHLRSILNYMGNSVPDATGIVPDAPQFANALFSAYPNPFNPTTTIKYTIKDRAHVSLKVYNAAGQLIRTLVDDVQAPDQVQPVTWDGANNAGQTVSSGVYFYKLVTKNFSQTKKMVLLK